MQPLVKKISILFLIVSLGWFPIQVTFATSFVLPSNSAEFQENPSQLNKSKSLQQVNKAKSGCKMHKTIQACCSKDSMCNASDQECGHCLSFIAMANEQARTIFLPIFLAHYNVNYYPTSLTPISTYRPPRLI